MWAPGLVGLAVGFILLFVVRDSPEQVGFPPVEVVEKAKPKKEADGSDGPKESLITLLINNVLKNPFIWGMALTYFFIYVVRQGVTSWFVFYLIKARTLPLALCCLQQPFALAQPLCMRRRDHIKGMLSVTSAGANSQMCMAQSLGLSLLRMKCKRCNMRT